VIDDSKDDSKVFSKIVLKRKSIMCCCTAVWVSDEDDDGPYNCPNVAGELADNFRTGCVVFSLGLTESESGSGKSGCSVFSDLKAIQMK
jgi:hypothetical protein